MKLYRSLSVNELDRLLKDGTVAGRYNLSTEKQSTGVLPQAVCFFAEEEPFWWMDSVHKVFVIIDIPESECTFGSGTYFAARDLAKSRIWSGKKGKTEYHIREAYLDHYSLKDIAAVSLPNYTYRALRPYVELLQKMNIRIMPHPKALQIWGKEKAEEALQKQIRAVME